MNILVTGGAGYIGSTLVEELNGLDIVNNIYVLDNLSRSPLTFFLGDKTLHKVEFTKGDILDAYALEKLVSKADVVYHLAGYVSSPYNFAQNVQYEQVNQWGTLNLVRCIQQSKHRIQHFIYLSSTSVYGLRGKVNILNDVQPTNAYGKSKLEGEKFSALLKDLCQVSIIRCANVFGFNNCFRVDSVLNNFIFHALVNKKILIYGDGTQQRPFTSLKQIVSMLLGSVFADNRAELQYAIGFNANLIELKDWLTSRVSDLEYTFVNRNINYEGLLLEGFQEMTRSQTTLLLDQAFGQFEREIRIKARHIGEIKG